MLTLIGATSEANVSDPPEVVLRDCALKVLLNSLNVMGPEAKNGPAFDTDTDIYILSFLLFIFIF